MNLAFLRIIVKVKLRAKFYLHSFEWFCLQISKEAKYFSSFAQDVVIKDLHLLLYPFLNSKKKKKEENSHIAIGRVISSHMGPMGIETPCTYTLNIYIWFVNTFYR